jgi:hypothetical protein
MAAKIPIALHNRFFPFCTTSIVKIIEEDFFAMQERFPWISKKEKCGPENLELDQRHDEPKMHGGNKP